MRSASPQPAPTARSSFGIWPPTKRSARSVGTATMSKGWPSARMASAGCDGTVRIWDSRPLDADRLRERGTLGLLELLFARPLLWEEVVAEIRRNPALEEPTRADALALVGRYRDQPQRLAEAAR